MKLTPRRHSPLHSSTLARGSGTHVLAALLILCCCALAPRSLSARGGGGCLERGTPVLTPDGNSPVDRLKEGDAVLAVSHGRLREATVKAVVRVQPDEFYEVVAGGHVLRLTDSHPIETEPGVFRVAATLKAGDAVRIRDGAAVRTATIDSVSRTPATEPAFNLLVAPGGTYVAGGMVVHNKGCFLPETPVRKQDGTDAPISAIRPGDRLLAFTPDGRVTAATVQRVLSHDVDEYCVVTTGTRVLHVTAEHPFFVGGGVFKTLEALKPGDEIFVFDGHGLAAQRIGGIATIHAATRVYNLQTDAPNTFFANGVAVHNKGGGCLEQGTPVMTPTGAVPIEQLRAGDTVVAVRHGQALPATVQAVTRVYPGEYRELSVGGRVLRVTETHPVEIEPGVFRVAGALAPGDGVRTLGTGALAVGTVDRVTRTPARLPAYDLLVAPGGTYVAAGVIVHNKGCFLPETPIRKDDGTEVSIATIKTGDRVQAFTPEGNVVSATVRQVIVHQAYGYCVVRTKRLTLHVTEEHPFFVGRGTFRTLEALKVGDSIFAFDGRGLTPQRIESIETVKAATTVYNLQTDAPNTFFANGVAVHNKGGGSHGGSHSSSSGGGSDGDPRIFLVVVFGIILILLVRRSSTVKPEGELDFVFTPAQVAKKSEKTMKLLEFLAKQDQEMLPATLTQRATSTFLTLQQCWQARDYGPMKPLMMPDLYADHCRQLQGLVRNHEINVIEGVRVDRVDLVNVRYTLKENQREFTVLITATATDYYVDDRTKQRVRGDTGPAQFQEFWTFQRQDGSWLLRDVEQTGESDALKEDNFFEQFTDSGVDQIYGAAAGKEGPAGPWLEKEAGAKDTRIERLLNFLVQTDKLWNRQTMTETSRRIFLELMGAWESGDPAAVPDADLFPELAADLKKQVADNRSQGVTLEFRNLCVRKVELLLVRNFTDNTQDEFVVRIRAHAQKVKRRNGAETEKDDDVTAFEQFLTLGRLDKTWKLKEILSPELAQGLVVQDNLDQDSNAQQVQWYYQHKRAI